MIKVSKKEVISYLINYQRFGEAKSIEDVLTYHGCIQVDPISTVAKSHEMSLFWRYEKYKQGEIESELYKTRRYFEYWMQRYSIIPSEYWKYFEVVRKYKKPWTLEFENKHKKEIDAILELINTKGEIAASDLKHLPKGSGFHSWKEVLNHTGYLQYLWEIGLLIVSSRIKNRKYYDVSKNYFKKGADIDIVEVEKFFLEKSFQYSGICSEWWMGQTRFAKILNLKQYLKSNEVVNLEIEGNKKYYILTKDMERFEEFSKKATLDETIVLPPLDPMVMDRDMIEFLLGYKYRWNVYTKPEKRTGFYNMLVLSDNKIKGEVALYKKDKNLAIESMNVKMDLGLEKAIVKLENFVFGNK